MSAGPFEADLAMPFGVAARGQGGAKLIARIPLFAGTTNGLVPAGAGWISARAVGAGGGSDRTVSNAGGGGAAFAREDRVCASGQSYTAVVGAGVVFGDGNSSTLTLAGTLILLAEGGKKFQTAGLAANSIGTVRSSGGAGASAGAGSPGTNGGLGGPGGAGGGGSAGERNAADALILGGNGANGFSGRGGFPGGGAQFFYTDTAGTASQAAGGDGLIFLEFWSAKP